MFIMDITMTETIKRLINCVTTRSLNMYKLPTPLVCSQVL